MRATQIDFKSLLPYAIQAYTEVFGEEYQSIISDKINSSIIIPYDDIQGLKTYIEFRKGCKKKELFYRFLEQIGIKVSKQDNYYKSLSPELENIINSIIGPSYNRFELENDSYIILRAFKKNNPTWPERLLRNKLKLINYLRETKEPQITEENLEEFLKTSEYNELLLKINEMNRIYDDLLKEFIEWEKQFESDINFIQGEKNRKKKIIENKKKEIWISTFLLSPKPLREVLEKLSLENQISAMFDDFDLDEEFKIESFSQESINKLTSPNVSNALKFCIVNSQLNFLESIGCQIPDIDMSINNLRKNIDSYLQFLNQDNIKQFIPSDEVISYIKKLRERKSKEATKDFTIGREDFQDALSIFSNKHEFTDNLTGLILERRVCITSGGATTGEGKFISLMFFTIRAAEVGKLAFILLHELGHVIDQSKRGTGFEPSSDYNTNGNKNPYDNAYRKYERFNETITDIFTIEATKLLHKKNIFLIEPKEITDLSCYCLNTSTIVHSLLKPLIEKFRKQVIKAKIFSQPKLLTEYIGENNFEDLVDVVNKVDFLTRNGLTEEKIEKEPQNPMVIEYNKQLERIKKIYQSIDEYYTNYCASLKEKEQKQNS